MNECTEMHTVTVLLHSCLEYVIFDAPSIELHKLPYCIKHAKKYCEIQMCCFSQYTNLIEYIYAYMDLYKNRGTIYNGSVQLALLPEKLYEQVETSQEEGIALRYMLCNDQGRASLRHPSNWMYSGCLCNLTPSLVGAVNQSLFHSPSIICPLFCLA